MQILFAVVAGALFGIGMMVSGMANPARVLGFFDVFGQWDPTLAWVMAGAIVPMAIAWRIRRRLSASFLGQALPEAPATTIDKRLIGGSALFGVGWGVAGICPGAVVPALGFGGWPVALFASVMLSTMLITHCLAGNRTKPGSNHPLVAQHTPEV